MTETSAYVQRRSRILVVDDAESIRLLFQRLLTADGHDVFGAHDGEVALEAVSQHQPDPILPDAAIAGLGGLEVCRRLKADAATRLTPIVLVTGKAGLNDRLKGLAAGADEILAKPLNPPE